MEHEQANNSRVEEQTPKKSFCGPVTGGDNFLQKALPSNPDQTVPLQPLGVNATTSSHANNREGRRNSSESGNRSEETTAKVWAKSTKGWMLCLLVDVAMFSASLGLSLAAALVKPHKLALFIAGPLVAALAVLWSVFRLYDLLKPSALTSEEEYAERQSLLSTTWTKETDRQLRGCLRQFSLMFNMLNREIGRVVAPGVGRGAEGGAPRNLIDATIRHATKPDTTHLAKILS
ncbi:hypothetical protein C361_02933 [Cryptococcus neoformans Tu259-1]|uniref:Uncharacterized protein n=1 Tax=Cryptococcus neoformans Tu259-1 TaxID=1230072 RepID=A0A854QFY6_CRYNE|nr:hypothetical protein C361_02933 [Cryptococcus neoformans var. grubii Tu259-1]